ncbi:MAG: hypothetical protein FJ149_11805 [Euryarchaeota archaeon]|nr:hypothetical protein [Euryarchaeota archaeon]
MASYLLPRPFPYNAGRFRFAFRIHLVAITALALLAVVLLRLLPRLVFVAYFMIFAIALIAALMLLNALPPVRTTHSVDGERVVLRQGLHFRLEIPLAKISKARRTEVGSGRPGIRLDRASGALEVIASGPEAVRLRLNDPVVHKGTLVREVVVDVLEPREFIDCIRERKKGAALMKKLDPDKEVTGPDSEPGEPDEEPPEEPAPREPDLPAPPPIKTSKKPESPSSEPGPAPEPEQPQTTKRPPGPDDGDEIELVPALPSSAAPQGRVVRIPKRKA